MLICLLGPDMLSPIEISLPTSEKSHDVSWSAEVEAELTVSSVELTTGKKLRPQAGQNFASGCGISWPHWQNRESGACCEPDDDCLDDLPLLFDTWQNKNIPTEDYANNGSTTPA
jgi:hypothetical protein